MPTKKNIESLLCDSIFIDGLKKIKFIDDSQHPYAIVELDHWDNYTGVDRVVADIGSNLRTVFPNIMLESASDGYNARIYNPYTKEDYFLISIQKEGVKITPFNDDSRLFLQAYVNHLLRQPSP